MSPQQFLEKAKSSSEVILTTTHTSDDKFWDYYFEFIGFLNGKYFSIIFKSVSGSEAIKISTETENLEYFKTFFEL